MDGWKVNDERWTFNENFELVGLWGETSPNGIEKLGMITLDKTCQAVKDAEAAAAAAAAAALLKPETITPVKTEDDNVGPLGLTVLTWVIIVCGAIAFCLLINLTLCALRKGFSSKESKQIAVETVKPATKPKKERRKREKSDIESAGFSTEGEKQPSKYPQLS